MAARMAAGKQLAAMSSKGLRAIQLSNRGEV
jgi:hypothetical protein